MKSDVVRAVRATPGRRRNSCLLSVAMTMLCGAAATAQESRPAGYTVAPDARGVWAFAAPDGSRFFSLGVNNVSPSAWNPRPETRYYDAVERQFGGDAAAWSAATRALLVDHGFNTVGAWSRKEAPAGNGLHRTIVLYVVGHGPDRCFEALAPDYEERVRKNMQIVLDEYPDRTGLMGVFLDNEMPWWGRSAYEPSRNYTLLERALDLDASSPAREAAVRFLRSRYADSAALAAAWQIEERSWEKLNSETLRLSVNGRAAEDRAAFTRLVAERFFSVASRVVREALPGVLVLGVRHGGDAPDAVLEAEGRYCDVISLNDYNFSPQSALRQYTRFWLLTKRPLMITEFSWRARENSSGNPNTRGAGPVVATQADRARHYEEFLREIASIPIVVGAHWFEFADQSPQGRFDGEDSNYGIVDIDNRPYTTLLGTMKRVHGDVAKIRARTERTMPKELPALARPSFAPGQRPERAAALELLKDWVREPEIWHAPDASLAWTADSDGLSLKIDVGTSYGCGLSFYGPKSAALKDGPADATDLDGYSQVVIEYTAPRGLQLNFVLAEAGSGPPGKADYSSSAGDDGEAFISDAWYAPGKRAVQRIAIRDLERQRFWGNQRGGNQIETRAVLNLGLQFQGTPRNGVVTLHSLRFER